MCCIRHIQNSGIFRAMLIQSNICRHILDIAALAWHIHAYWSIIKVYSVLFRHIQHPVEPSHIHNLVIFRATYSKLCENLTRNIQNPAIARTVHSDIIHPFSEPCVTFTYAETWHVRNPVIFRTLP